MRFVHYNDDSHSVSFVHSKYYFSFEDSIQAFFSLSLVALLSKVQPLTNLLRAIEIYFSPYQNQFKCSALDVADSLVGESAQDQDLISIWLDGWGIKMSFGGVKRKIISFIEQIILVHVFWIIKTYDTNWVAFGRGPNRGRWRGAVAVWVGERMYKKCSNSDN